MVLDTREQYGRPAGKRSMTSNDDAVQQLNNLGVRTQANGHASTKLMSEYMPAIPAACIRLT